MALEDLKKRLYREKEKFEERIQAPEISLKSQPLIDVFQNKKKFEEPSEMKKNKKIKKIWIFVMVAIIAVISFFIFQFGIFQFQNIDIKIEGPIDLQSGSQAGWDVFVTNKNSKNMEDVVLVFSIGDVFKEKVNFGVIKSGETVKKNFQTIVFGGRGSELEARVSLEYRLDDSLSFFAKENKIFLNISQSPVTVSFAMSDEVVRGEEVAARIKFFSQSDSVTPNLFLKAEYPKEFEYKSASVQPSEGNNVWEIGKLSPGTDGEIIIYGSLKNENVDTAIFKASLGILQNGKILSLDESSHVLSLRQPLLEINILPLGKNSYNVSLGEEIEVFVRWKNNLPEEVLDASLFVGFDDKFVDFSSVKVSKGLFNSSSKKIIWNSTTLEDLKSVLPGTEGQTSFSFRVKKNIVVSDSSIRPKIDFLAEFVSGKSIPGFENANIGGKKEFSIPISTSLQFSQRVLYFGSSISNFGPLPPKVGNQTSYTVTWTLANPLSDIKNFTAKTFLPPYIDFKNVFLPTNANVFYNKNTGSLEWKVDTVSSGTGFNKPAISLVFQIIFEPSLNQVGSSPELLNSTEIFGLDSFTESNLSFKEGPVTIDLHDDSQIGFGMDKVVE